MPPKLSKKQEEVSKVFSPDENGFSDWVSRITIDNNPNLNWGNNGAARHGIYFGDNRYIWEKQGKGKITALRTNGMSDDILYGHVRPIKLDIRKFYKTKGCVVCGSRSDLVCDHKNDLYNDPRVLSMETQTKEDFQSLCNHCNLQKKQVNIKTRKTGKRIGATTIPSVAVFGVDYTQGDETFDSSDVDAMVGTYWYDPVDFMKKIKNIK